MRYPKFIIEGENLIMAKCTYHKELATDKEQVKGGGWFRYDDKKEAFILGGSSYDFGYAKIEDIKKCIEDGNVYGNTRLTRNMSDYKFLYDTQTELIELN
jgi:hypothetical protein